MTTESRLLAIVRVMDELAACRACTKKGDLSLLLWEVDWLSELHGLLYEES